MKTRECLGRTSSSPPKGSQEGEAEQRKQSLSYEDQISDLLLDDERSRGCDDINSREIVLEADSTTTQNGSGRIRNSSQQQLRRASQRSKKAPQKAAVHSTSISLEPRLEVRSQSPFNHGAIVENGVVWGMELPSPTSVLESRLKGDLSVTRMTSTSGATKTKATKSSRIPRSATAAATTNNHNNHNNNHNNNNNSNLKNNNSFLIANRRRETRRGRSLDDHHHDDDEVLMTDIYDNEDGDDDDDSSSLTLIDSEILEVPVRRSFSPPDPGHREERREKKAKVKLKDSPPNQGSLSPLTTLPFMGIEEEKKKRKEDNRKEDKNKKKKLKHIEEENLSKRLYESRDILAQDSRPNGIDLPCRPPPVSALQSLPNSSFVGGETIPTTDEDRRGVLRLKACGECGARHASGGCPFTRPTQRLPDSCPLPAFNSASTPQNGVIVAPPHRDPPNAMSMEETWREAQRPGSPSCYARTSLPLGLGLEMRVVPPPQEVDGDDDVGVMGVTSIKARQVEVVVAKKVITRFTQLGPVVGVPVREKDIPDDFCMINLWEVFGGEGKRYLSTVDPRRSNWTRYLRPAPDRDSANLVVVPRQLHDPGDDLCMLGPSGEPTMQPVESVGGVAVFLVTTQDIDVGEELLFWAHDPTLTWSRKKMEKTNCGGCNMRFSHPLYYRMHCSVFHDPNYSLTIRKYHCKVCGLAVLGKENIMRHAAEQHEGRGAYQCQFCKKFFLRLNYLDMHRTYGCAANPQRTRPLCDFCGRKFCQPQKLKVHIKRMHSDMAEVLREFQCKLCFKILGSRAALQRHLKEVHHKGLAQQDLSTGATCDRCGKMFQNKSNLKIHMLTHSGVKPFRCTESSCNAAFTTKQCLQFHYKKVHGYSGDSMPKIERCIPYTFDSYSGGLVPDPGRGKVPLLPNMTDNSSTGSNSPIPLSHDDDLLKDSMSHDDDDEPLESLPIMKSSSSPRSVSRSPELILDSTKLPPAATLHGYVAKYAAAATRLVSKGSRKWLGDSLDSFDRENEGQAPTTPRDIYAFDDRLDNDLLQRRRDKSDNEIDDDKILFRRESNASLLVEAALNVAEITHKGELRSVGTHDRLLSYGGGNGLSSGRYSPTPSVSSSVDHLLPHDTALSTHIKYTTSTDDERGHLEYTLEREYDPRELPEVMVVHEGMSSRDLNDSLNSDLQEHLHSLEHLPPASVGDSSLQELHNVHNLSLTKTEDMTPATPATPSDSVASMSSSNGLEPTLHVLEQGLPVSIPSSLAIGLDMTYKHYRLVPESTIAISHDHLLAATNMEDNEGSIGLETITSSGGVNCHQMSPRHDHMGDPLSLPELQPHDFRGLTSLRSPETSRSPYLSPSHTPEETLRSYLVSAEGLRSPSSEHGIDMSRGNLFIRSSDLQTVTYRYQGDSPNGTRSQLYEIERPPSQSMDLSLVGRTLSYAEVSRSMGGTTVYITEARPDSPGSGGSTVYLTDQRDDFRHSLDLTLPRSDESLSRVDSSPMSHNRSESPLSSPQHQLSPINQLSPTTQISLYSQLSPHIPISSHSHFSPLPQMTTLERMDTMSPEIDMRESLNSQSPLPSTSLSLPPGTPLPPISRIVTTSPHSFYSTRQLFPVSRQDISLSVPTHVYTESYMVANDTTLDQQPPTPGPTPPSSSSSNSKDRASPYLQYPSSPSYSRHQELASPPPGFHYQYY